MNILSYSFSYRTDRLFILSDLVGKVAEIPALNAVWHKVIFFDDCSSWQKELCWHNALVQYTKTKQEEFEIKQIDLKHAKFILR